MFIDRGVDKEDMVYIHNGILLIHWKERNTGIFSNKDGPRNYHAKRRQSNLSARVSADAALGLFLQSSTCHHLPPHFECSPTNNAPTSLNLHLTRWHLPLILSGVTSCLLELKIYAVLVPRIHMKENSPPPAIKPNRCFPLILLPLFMLLHRSCTQISKLPPLGLLSRHQVQEISLRYVG